MGKLIILNGSPRAPRSNSKKYIQLFQKYWKKESSEYSALAKTPVREEDLAACEELLLVFPLYADGLPAVLLSYLKVLEQASFKKHITVHVLVNCGFLEPEQCGTVLKMIRFYCEKCGFLYGMTLCIGSGEAILTTPFRYLAERRIKDLVKGMQRKEQRVLKTRMPLTKRLFVKASKGYWLSYGRKYGVDEEQMKTMIIEKQEDIKTD